MFERLKRLYNEGKITEAGLDFWVSKGVITEEQKWEIIRSNELEEMTDDTDTYELI